MDERPVIVAVDDEADALSAMLDALTRRFAGDYRIASHLSPRAALDEICAIREKGGEIALVIADQRMPEMTGRDFLGRVRSIMPMAKRALLVDWGDRDASPTILQACALGELDNYLYKPWSPAEVHLYPLISEFLSEWTQVYRPGMELIHGRDLLDALDTAMGKRAEPLMIVISTQAARDEAPLSNLIDYGLRIQRGEITDPSFHLTFYSAPEMALGVAARPAPVVDIEAMIG